MGKILKLLIAIIIVTKDTCVAAATAGATAASSLVRKHEFSGSAVADSNTSSGFVDSSFEIESPVRTQHELSGSVAANGAIRIFDGHAASVPEASIVRTNNAERNSIEIDAGGDIQVSEGNGDKKVATPKNQMLHLSPHSTPQVSLHEPTLERKARRANAAVTISVDELIEASHAIPPKISPYEAASAEATGSIIRAGSSQAAAQESHIKDDLGEMSGHVISLESTSQKASQDSSVNWLSAPTLVANFLAGVAGADSEDPPGGKEMKYQIVGGLGVVVLITVVLYFTSHRGTPPPQTQSTA